jgi:hypothetical protein
MKQTKPKKNFNLSHIQKLFCAGLVAMKGNNGRELRFHDSFSTLVRHASGEYEYLTLLLHVLSVQRARLSISLRRRGRVPTLLQSVNNHISFLNSSKKRKFSISE